MQAQADVLEVGYMHSQCRHESKEEDTVLTQEPVGCYSYVAPNHTFARWMEQPCNVGWAGLTSLAR